MHATAEGDVPIGLTRHVEGLRIVEVLRIPVGGAEQLDDDLVAGQPLATELRVLRDAPEGALDGTVVAQALLDGSAQGGIVTRGRWPAARGR